MATLRSCCNGALLSTRDACSQSREQYMLPDPFVKLRCVNVGCERMPDGPAMHRLHIPITHLRIVSATAVAQVGERLQIS